MKKFLLKTFLFLSVILKIHSIHYGISHYKKKYLDNLKYNQHVISKKILLSKKLNKKLPMLQKFGKIRYHNFLTSQKNQKIRQKILFNQYKKILNEQNHLNKIYSKNNKKIIRYKTLRNQANKNLYIKKRMILLSKRKISLKQILNKPKKRILKIIHNKKNFQEIFLNDNSKKLNKIVNKFQKVFGNKQKNQMKLTNHQENIKILQKGLNILEKQERILKIQKQQLQNEVNFPNNDLTKSPIYHFVQRNLLDQDEKQKYNSQIQNQDQNFQEKRKEYSIKLNNISLKKQELNLDLLNNKISLIYINQITIENFNFEQELKVFKILYNLDQKCLSIGLKNDIDFLKEFDQNYLIKYCNIYLGETLTTLENIFLYMKLFIKQYLPRLSTDEKEYTPEGFFLEIIMNDEPKLDMMQKVTGKLEDKENIKKSEFKNIFEDLQNYQKDKNQFLDFDILLDKLNLYEHRIDLIYFNNLIQIIGHFFDQNSQKEIQQQNIYQDIDDKQIKQLKEIQEEKNKEWQENLEKQMKSEEEDYKQSDQEETNLKIENKKENVNEIHLQNNEGDNSEEDIQNQLDEQNEQIQDDKQRKLKDVGNNEEQFYEEFQNDVYTREDSFLTSKFMRKNQNQNLNLIKQNEEKMKRKLEEQKNEEKMEEKEKDKFWSIIHEQAEQNYQIKKKKQLKQKVNRKLKKSESKKKNKKAKKQAQILKKWKKLKKKELQKKEIVSQEIFDPKKEKTQRKLSLIKKKLIQFKNQNYTL